jgi:DNA repair exonuclease SbcCD ATPase subunit
MIVFEKIRWKNFLSTGNQFIEVNLNQHQDTLIVGHNGAGKSTILDALCFTLFNKPFRDVRKDQMVNSVNLGGTETELEFSISNNRYKITRGIKPNKFEIYQNDTLLDQDATVADYQKQLENNILRFNYRSFTQVVILGSSAFVPFMELKSTHRREVVEDILDIKIFSIMSMLVKIQIKEVEEQFKEIGTQINIMQNKIETQETYIEQTGKQVQDTIDDYNKKIEENNSFIDNYKSHMTGIAKEISQIKTTIEDEDTVRVQVKKFNTFEAQIETKLSDANKHKRFFETQDTCPTCTQSIDDEFKQGKLQEDNAKILKFNQALEEINQQITNKQRRLEKIASVYEDIKVNEIDVAKFSQSINELNNINTKLQNQVNNLMQQSEDTGQAKGRLIELQDQMKVLEDGKLKKIEDLDYLQAAREMLTDSGIKTKVIKQYLPIMNQLINRYLASMDFFINFKLDNEFREIIRSRFRDEFSYSSFSEGEKVRINLALLFTWRAIAKMKNSISTNLLLLDEIFDSSLDGQGTDDFIKILNTLEGENVFIISHKQDLIIDKFKNVMKFEKYKNFTRIAE